MTSNDYTLFAILARAGSKRLPGKCTLTVGRVPLLGRAVLTARRTAARLDNPTRIIVSTDDAHLAGVARSFGADTPFLRPPELATDTATSVDALRHLVQWCRANDQPVDEIVLIQPTSPLTRSSDVLAAIQEHRAHPDVSAVAVTPADEMAALVFSQKQGVLHADDRRAGPHVRLNGAVYVFSPAWLSQHEALCMPGQSRAVVMPADQSVDVDTRRDLETARALYELQLPWQPDRCLIIAEAGVNHDGSLDTARRLVDAAQQAGADAVKFQTFSAERLATRSAPKAEYQSSATGSAESQYEMLKKLELSADDHRVLLDHCRQVGVTFLSSAFSEPDVDLLDALDVPAIKLGSAELTNHPLLVHAAATGRPLIVSTGCAYLHEVARAVDLLYDQGCHEVALLHCVSNYPAAPADVNLRAMDTLARAFGCPVGYSDHTLGIEIAVAAVARGARIIEKHFTLDRSLPGPDHAASLEPHELDDLVTAIRNAESALGDGIKQPADSEANTRQVARRSLVAIRRIDAGSVLTPDLLTTKRPGTGISPALWDAVMGMQLMRPLAADEPLTWDHLRAPREKA